MKKIVKTITRLKFVVFLFYLFIRGYLLTIKVKIENEKEWFNKVNTGTPVLLCCFHQQFFYMVRCFRKYFVHQAAIIISQSRDGDIGALIAQFSGVKTCRGSSSKGGKKAMEEMIAFLSSNPNRFGINLVDGPQGPLGKVKPGSIRIAQKAGALIVPVYFISKRVWQMNSWDKFIVPKPFSNVTMKFGELMQVDDDKSKQRFEAGRLKLEQTMAPYLVTNKNKRVYFEKETIHS